MADLAKLHQFRDRLEDARFSGARRVRDQNGEEVEYRSDSELARALSAVEAKIRRINSGAAHTIKFQTRKGV